MQSFRLPSTRISCFPWTIFKRCFLPKEAKPWGRRSERNKEEYGIFFGEILSKCTYKIVLFLQKILTLREKENTISYRSNKPFLEKENEDE